VSPEYTLRAAADAFGFFSAAAVHDAELMSLEAPAALRESGDACGAPDSILSCQRQPGVNSQWR